MIYDDNNKYIRNIIIIVSILAAWFCIVTTFFIHDHFKAEASVRQTASWFSIEDMAGDVARENMSLAAGQKYDTLLRDLTNVCF